MLWAQEAWAHSTPRLMLQSFIDCCAWTKNNPQAQLNLISKNAMNKFWTKKRKGLISKDGSSYNNDACSCISRLQRCRPGGGLVGAKLICNYAWKIMDLDYWGLIEMEMGRSRDGFSQNSHEDLKLFQRRRQDFWPLQHFTQTVWPGADFIKLYREVLLHYAEI